MSLSIQNSDGFYQLDMSYLFSMIRFRRFLGVFGAMRFFPRPRNEHSLLQSSVSWCFNWSNAIKGLGSNDLAAWLPRISKAGRRRLESPPPVCVSSVRSSVCVFCLFGCFWWQQGSVFNMELLVSIYIYIFQNVTKIYDQFDHRCILCLCFGFCCNCILWQPRLPQRIHRDVWRSH